MARWLRRSGGLAVLLLAAAEAESPWTVQCNADCGGVDTCAEKQLCDGSMVEFSICPDAQPCPQPTECWPQDCQWGEWRDWENDGVSGLCFRKRHFSPSVCGGVQCLGLTKDSMDCDITVHPPEPCEFGPWGEWSACDAQSLQMSRQRAVAKEPQFGGDACEGPLVLTEPCGNRIIPVPCILGDWMEWSGCSRECGGGQQTQVRAITQKAAAGGKLCEGEDGRALVLQKTQPCNVDITCGGEPVPQDCLVSEWSEWSACDPDVPKRARQRYRTRSIAVPGKWGGSACSSSLSETQGCEESEYLPPVDCRLSSWSAWNLCDKTCQGGQTFRHRTVEVPGEHGGRPCQDALNETQPCNEFPCLVDPLARDCQMSLWTEWSGCSTSCGEGVKHRDRAVLAPPLEGGVGCSASLQQVTGCFDNPSCDAHDCEWGSWTEWSSCTKTCDGGQKSRNRTIFNEPSKSGAACKALSSVNEIASCGTEPCSTASCKDGVWHDWGEWGQCSRACAGGVSWRHRKVAEEASSCGTPAVGPAMELKQCNKWPCEEDRDCSMSTWTSWGECSASCYGQQTRERKIEHQGSGAGFWCVNPDFSPAPLEQSRPCNGPQESDEALDKACGFGEVQDCLVGTWSIWSVCSASCGGGHQKRTRGVLRPAKLGGAPCEDDLEEVQGCGDTGCGMAMDCEWEDWDEWGACTHCAGEKIRVREIRHLGNELGTSCAASSSREVAQCNECPKQTKWCVWAAWEDGSCSATCGTGGRLERKRMLQTLSAPPSNPLDAVGNVTGAGASCEAYEVEYTECKDVPLECSSCVPEDCLFGDWEEWAQPTTCDGVCTRKRQIKRLQNDCGKACNGNLEETKPCILAECAGKQDCVFSHWSAWAGCSDTSSQQTRVREIATQNGPFGEPCDGAQKQTQPCEVEEHVRDCRLSHWSEWGECSKSCGGGQMEMSREVLEHALHGGAACTGPTKLTKSCNMEMCSVGPNPHDCLLGDWSEWRGCDEGSQALRTRSPVREASAGGSPCSGATKEAGECPAAAARDCAFSDWGDWGSCGATCGGGQRFRTREVKDEAEPGGKPCEGDTHETETCNEEVSCDVAADCVISHWSMWSQCSVSCGQGLYARERKVLQAAQPAGRGCNVVLWEVHGCMGASTNSTCGDDVDCQWGRWGDWSECKEAEYCGLGYRSRSRSIAVPPKGSGAKCDPLPQEEVESDLSCAKSCTPSGACVDAEWSEWSSWGSCSVTCGRGGTRKRYRQEKVEANHCGYPAPGDSVEYEPCDASAECESQLGAQDCEFGGWSSWEECSASCNGNRKRTRAIAQYGAYGGKPCVGSIGESQRCNPSPEDHAPPMGCISGAPVDCVQWPPSEWSSCSTTCGVGHQVRHRQVAVQPAFGGKACQYPLEEVQQCQAGLECEILERDCLLSDWEDWHGCEPFAAQQSRHRHVKQSQAGLGKACHGNLTETQACSRLCEDKTYYCSWGQWAEWTSCSQSCGTRGRRHRRRSLELAEATATAKSGAEAAKPAELAEKFQLISQLKAASGRRHLDLAASFVAGMAVFGSFAGLVTLAIRRAPRQRSLLRPLAEDLTPADQA